MRRNILIGFAVLATVAFGALLILDYGFGIDLVGNSESRQARETLKAYRAAAERGEAYGQYGLGGLYYAGIAVDRDSKEAFKWFRKAAEQGLRPAQRNIGVMYYSGVGVAKDAKEALIWYRKAAEQRDAVAQFEIGKLYGKGEGVARDDKVAYAWFTIAWENGEPRAAGARDKTAGQLTPAQISDAKKRAQEWLDEHP